MNTSPPVTVYGSPPTPTPTIVCPIRLSGPHVPRSACASPHSFTEDNVPSSPGGIVKRTEFRFWLPSPRLIVIVNGLNPPAWILVVPAVSDGLNGSGLAQGRPPGPEITRNVEDGDAGGVPDHGAIELVVGYEPHEDGVANGARSPPKKCSSKSSKGTWGVSLHVATSCPVTGSGTTSPATFTSVPDTGSWATTYIATRLPNGFASCAAR